MHVSRAGVCSGTRPHNLLNCPESRAIGIVIDGRWSSFPMSPDTISEPAFALIRKGLRSLVKEGLKTATLKALYRTRRLATGPSTPMLVHWKTGSQLCTRAAVGVATNRTKVLVGRDRRSSTPRSSEGNYPSCSIASRSAACSMHLAVILNG